MFISPEKNGAVVRRGNRNLQQILLFENSDRVNKGG